VLGRRPVGVCGVLTVAVGVCRIRSAMEASGIWQLLPRRATWLRWSGWWGTTRACSTPGMRRHGRTPLMWASRGPRGVVRWLLDQGAAINERTEDGCTALWVRATGCLPVVRLLLERGADPTIAYGR
jgi:hypothetical protein